MTPIPPLKPADVVTVSPHNAPVPAQPPGIPLWRLGFRPFYAGAAVFGTLAIPAWALMYAGQLAQPQTLPGLWWHAHEMLFGFVCAVIVGFLLTAGKAWTGRTTLRGPGLAILFMLWVTARGAALWAPYAVFATLDAAFLPIVAVLLTTLFVRAGNTRNLPVAGIVGLLAVANATFHAAVLGWVPVPVLSAVHAAVACVVMLECVIAGRVIPGFSMSALPGLKIKAAPKLEAGTLPSTVVALALWVVWPASGACAVACLLAATCHGVRQARWQPLQTRHRPILWILHAAYAWIAGAFVLMALAAWGWVPPSAGLHGLTVGATGGMIIGMLTRTARGHTGRTLQVSRAEVGAYGLVLLAAVLRVFGPLAAPHAIGVWVGLAAVFWAVAFGTYAWVFVPWLVRTRADGRDG